MDIFQRHNTKMDSAFLWHYLASHDCSAREQIEVRVQQNKKIKIAMVDGVVISHTETATEGVSSRVFSNGCYGFASYPECSPHWIDLTLSEARTNACYLARQNGTGSARTKCTASSHQFIKDIYIDEIHLTTLIKDITTYCKNNYNNLSSVLIIGEITSVDKSMAGSSGSTSDYLMTAAMVMVELAVHSGDNTARSFQIFEELDDFTSLYACLDRLYRFVLGKSHSSPIEIGIYDVVLSGELAGLVAHEAIGHVIEADMVRGGSIGAAYLDRRIGNDCIHIVDFAHSYGERSCPVPIYIDDEGVLASDTVIVKSGIIRTFMNDRESAHYYGQSADGHARAALYSDEPLIRMRNTALLPGGNSIESMIRSIDHGYYLVRGGNGQADNNSEFMFSVVTGYQIVGGKIGNPIPDITIGGFATDLFHSVTMVGDRMEWMAGGICKKEQVVPVGIGGAAIKCRLRLGGV